MRFARHLVCALVMLLVIDVNAMSAARGENEDWESAYFRELQVEISDLNERELYLRTQASGTAVHMARPFASSSFDISVLPEWKGSFDQLRKAFAQARDERIYDSSNGFLRRASWLFPDDGCFARAAHVAQSFERQSLMRPGKVYAFGGLKLKTDYSPRGAVSWWYHVAPAYRSGKLVLVMDPAVQHGRPILLEEWMRRISRRPEVTRVAMCDTYSYKPSQPCLGGAPTQERFRERDQNYYLKKEWDRIARLGLDPIQQLRGDIPWGPLEIYRIPMLGSIAPAPTRRTSSR